MTATTPKRKRASTSPTKRSMDMLREHDYLVCKVEHWNTFAKKKFDFFNFADIVGLRTTEPGIVAVQATTQEHMGARADKILANPAAYLWALNGGKILIHGWRILKRGLSRPMWCCDVRAITVQDFNSHRTAAEGTT